jgi:predicted phosphodiesterase
MPFEAPIRILSDLHFGHPASLVGNAEDLAPVFQGARTVVFNGDTVEYRFKKDRPQAERNLAAVRAVCAANGAHPVFLNGNHDASIAPLNHLDLVDGAVLVTHGDMLFHDISPWSNEAPCMEAAHREALKKIEDEAFHDFEKRLHANKCGALAVELHESTLPRGPLARMVTYLREGWPPWRPLQIFRCWIEAPGRAVALARVFRSRARFILIGHTHYSGIWRRGPRVIINTGSFLPVAGRALVDIEGNRLTVRKIDRRQGRFSAGPVIETFEAEKLKAHEGF